MKRKLAVILGAICTITFLGGCSCEHKWTSATCESLAHCELCGEETGALAECIEGEGKIEIEPTLSVAGKKVINCAVCNKEIRSEEMHKSASAEKGFFNFSAEEFGDYFNMNLKLMGDGAYAAVVEAGGEAGCCYVLIMENSDKKVNKICVRSDVEMSSTALSLVFGTKLFGIDKDTAAYEMVSIGRYKENNVLFKKADNYTVEISPDI